MKDLELSAIANTKTGSGKKKAIGKQVLRLMLNLLFWYVILGLLMWTPVYTLMALRPFAPDEYYDRVRKLPGCQEYFIDNPAGDKLHAWLFRRPGAKKLFIVHHGNTGNLSDRLYLANAAIMSGASALLYDYRGYGLSTGSLSVPGLYEDGLAVYEFARNKLGFSPDQIINFGESLGTGVACKLASERRSAGLVLQSAVASLPSIARAANPIFHAYPELAFPQPHYDNVEQIQQVHVPVLLLHGIKDRLAPYGHSQLIHDMANAPKSLVSFAEAGHNDIPADSPAYQKALKQLLNGL